MLAEANFKASPVTEPDVRPLVLVFLALLLVDVTVDELAEALAVDDELTLLADELV